MLYKKSEKGFELATDVDLFNLIPKPTLLSLAEKHLFTDVLSGQDITNGSQVALYLSTKLNLKSREVFGVIYLSNDHRIIHDEVLFKGTYSEVSFSTRDVIIGCLNRSAASIIVYHNHVNSVSEPSRSDRALTSRLADACNLMDVALLDHVILGRNDWFSFADNGLL
ncbi:JAB domain-containing protein [Vibrio crassostreae]|uniref:JAB domain-containing protein n=1 Tax=Vibrio crassostreae TaxID=246167 RepID=UPI001B30ECDB|nr:JAB domain-containing protein [Vibrio crassostreae]